jgi:bacillithiol biosynthesis deacetylase BshB1
LISIDCLAFGPHPDDVELFCGGVLIKLKKQGYSTAIVDLSRGELSTNGDVETRLIEAGNAKDILNLDIRLNLGMKDGALEISRENRQEVIKTVRSLRPKICLVPYWVDRHPDHEFASELIKRAIFDSGLKKIDTGQEAYRPKTTIYYLLHNFIIPTFAVDISNEMDQKLEAIKAYVSQFSSIAKDGITTHINKPEFLSSIITRSEFLGQQIGVKYAEGFYYPGLMKVDNILKFFS